MKTTPRSQLLLVELICDLVIFAICAVVCVALLVQARVMSLESTRLTQAVYIAQTAAETYLAGEAVPATFDANGAAAVNGGTYLVDLTPADGGCMAVSVFLRERGTEEPVYTLTIKGAV